MDFGIVIDNREPIYRDNFSVSDGWDPVCGSHGDRDHHCESPRQACDHEVGAGQDRDNHGLFEGDGKRY